MCPGRMTVGVSEQTGGDKRGVWGRKILVHSVPGRTVLWEERVHKSSFLSYETHVESYNWKFQSL